MADAAAPPDPAPADAVPADKVPADKAPAPEPAPPHWHRVVFILGGIAALVVITMAQGSGPSASLLPGIDRFAGITGGLLILMVVSMMLWPGVDERHGQA